MTVQEAKMILEVEIKHHPEISIFSEALQIAIEALGKDMIPKTVLQKAINRIEMRRYFLGAFRFTPEEKNAADTAYRGALKDIRMELEAYEKTREETMPDHNDCNTEEGQQDKNIEIKTRWIPVSSGELPKTDTYILLSFENFSLLEIGRYEADKDGGAFYIRDNDESCASCGLFVNAWMPMFENYKEGEQE